LAAASQTSRAGDAAHCHAHEGTWRRFGSLMLLAIFQVKNCSIDFVKNCGIVKLYVIVDMDDNHSKSFQLNQIGKLLPYKESTRALTEWFWPSFLPDLIHLISVLIHPFLPWGFVMGVPQ
jgi:hypothetical protein